MGTLTGQVLGFSTRAPVPMLVLSTPDGAVRIPLEGRFRLEVDDAVHCTGKVRDGIRVPCPSDAVVTGSWSQCPACTDLEDPACVFEPKCKGNPEACTCVTSFRDVPHVVYIAWYGILPKVGITTARRIEARIQEQGADAWFLAADQEDGRPLARGSARRLEQEIRLLHHIPEYRRTREVLSQLTRPVPWDVLERRAKRLQEQMAKHYHVSPAGIHRMADHAFAPLPQKPAWRDPAGVHAGTWCGAKGPYLFYEPTPSDERLSVGTDPIAALKATWLTGRRVAVQ